ncbi:Endodeoxyribonuclease, RusA family protein, partial [human gut metagenome]
PRFELELFAESQYNFNYNITKKDTPCNPNVRLSPKKIMSI